MYGPVTSELSEVGVVCLLDLPEQATATSTRSTVMRTDPSRLRTIAGGGDGWDKPQLAQGSVGSSDSRNVG